ncbi:hypothetical protein AX16_002587 [Volvariella volvacea WC 439]|nr:hypothetical protein AX16_002587 [Volvariella volvacea WC 439]
MFTERHESLFPARSPLFERQMRVGRARRSSTFGGLDIYLRGSITGPVPRVQYYTPKDDAGAENQFGSLTSFVRLCLEYAEGAVEIADTVAGERHFMSMVSNPGLLNLIIPPYRHAQISVSTNVPSTAPSDYLTVRAYPDSDASSTWSELDPPETPTYPHPMRPQPVQQNNRRLRKSKPSEEPLPPSEVLERELYNHMTEPRLNTWRQYRLPNIANSIRKWTRPNGSQGASDAWVWIELSQEITEHYLN